MHQFQNNLCYLWYYWMLLHGLWVSLEHVQCNQEHVSLYASWNMGRGPSYRYVPRDLWGYAPGCSDRSKKFIQQCPLCIIDCTHFIWWKTLKGNVRIFFWPNGCWGPVGSLLHLPLPGCILNHVCHIQFKSMTFLVWKEKHFHLFLGWCVCHQC